MIYCPEGPWSLEISRRLELDPRRSPALGRHDAEAMVVGVWPLFCSSFLGAHRDAAKPRGERGINATFMRVFDGPMAFVPEGQADRSLARSACICLALWEGGRARLRPSRVPWLRLATAVRDNGALWDTQTRTCSRLALRAKLRSVVSPTEALAEISQQHLAS
jgi:hypothetical protein